MSIPLQSLVYKTLGVGQGKVFAVELPKSDDGSVAQRIKEYCKQLDRPCLIVNGDSLDKHSLLEKLQALFAIDNVSEFFKSSTFRSITKLLSRHRTGVLCVSSAQQMTHDSEHLLSQLVSYARKHKLAWKFYFLSKRSDEASRLNSSFGIQKSLMWNEREEDWFFVEKAGIGDTATAKKNHLYKGLAIASLLVVGIYLFLASQPKPQDILNNTKLMMANGTSNESGFSATETSNAPLHISDSKQVNAEFDRPFDDLSSISTVKPSVDSILQAVHNGDIAQFNALINQNSEYHKGINEHGQNVLIMAVNAKQKNIINEVLKGDVNVNHQDRHGRTALYYASISGQFDIVNVLLDANADINLEGSMYKTPLIVAVHNSHLDVVELLIRNDANIEIKDESGWTALFYAVWNSRLDLVDLLLSNGAKANVLDKSGNSLMEVALMRGSEEFQSALSARLISL